MRCIPYIFSAVILTTLLLSSHQLHAKDPDNDFLSKIEFDLSILNPNGLYGSSKGLKSLGYEFCIPADEKKIAEIHSIDPDIKVYKQSPGRIGCNSYEYLCMGETHNNAYQTILTELAKLPYIKRISQSFYE